MEFAHKIILAKFSFFLNLRNLHLKMASKLQQVLHLVQAKYQQGMSAHRMIFYGLYMRTDADKTTTN